MNKTDINIGDLMDDLAAYLGVNPFQLERALQLLVDGKLQEER